MENPLMRITVYADDPGIVSELYRMMGVPLALLEGGIWQADVTVRLEVRSDEQGRKNGSRLRMRVGG